MGRSGHYLPTHRPRAVVGRLTARLRLRTIFGLLVAVTSLALSRPAEAETYTWDGSSNASTWSDTYRPNPLLPRVSNWIGNSVPTTSSTSAYVFAGSTRTTNTNDIANLTALSMTFASDANAFTISGSVISLRGIVSNSSTNLQTINLDLVLGTSGTFDAASADIFVGGTISGVNTLIKTGVNDVILTAANTYSGGTTISGGRITLGNANGLGVAGAVTITSGTLDLNGRSITLGALSGSSGGTITTGVAGSVTLTSTAATDSTFAGAMTNGSGTMAVTKQGSGTLTLSGSSSYTGGTTISDGVLALGSANAVGTSGTISFGDGTLQFSASNTTDYSSRFSTAASQAYEIDTNGQNVTFASPLTSIGGTLTKSGTGTLTLSGNNSYTGDTRAAAGTLALGSVNGVANSTLDMNASDSGVVAFTVVGTQTYNVGSLKGSRNLAIGGNTLSVGGNGQSTTYAGSLSGGGTLTKSGNGTLTLAGNNSYTGDTRAVTGTLALGSVNGVAGSTLDMNVSDSGLVTFTVPGIQTYNVGGLKGSRDLAIGGNTLSVGVNGQSTTYAGSLSGTGVLAKEGTGTLTLSGSSSYTGGTTISDGVLALGSANAVGTSGTISFGDGTLQFSASNTTDYSSRFSTAASQAYEIDTNGQNVTFASPLTSIGGTLTKSGTGTLTLSGSSSYTGGTTIGAGAVAIPAGGSISHDSAYLVIGQLSGESGTLNVTGGSVTNMLCLLGFNVGSVGTATVSSGTWATMDHFDVGYSGAGTLNVTGGIVTNNNYGTLGLNAGSVGTATVSSGTWANSFDLVIGTSGTGTLTMTGGLVSVAGTLSRGTFGTINLNSGGTLQIGTGSTTGVLGVLTLTNNGTLIFNRSDDSTYSGIISGTGAVTKQGGGTLTLAGNNSYTGDTRTATGTLALGSVNALAGSMLDMNVSDAGVLSFNVAGIQTYNVGGLKGSRNLAIGGNTLAVGGNGESTTYAGSLSGTGALAKSGTGTLTLSNQTSFTNGLVAIAGRLIAGSTSSVNGFSTTGSLAVASGVTLELKSKGLAYVNGLSTLTGGTILAANGISLGAGANVVGAGAVSGRVSAVYGSRIEADGGNLSAGDSSSYAGFNSDGELYTNTNEVEFLDRNLAVLGSLTQLGYGSAGGTLRAANGMLLEQGKNLVGRGTVYGNFVNQGDVYGDGSTAGQKIIFAAGSTVSGIGSFENVVFDGTYSPGNSPAITNLSNGEFSSASSLVIELGGTQPGTQYDRVVDSGVLNLVGGTLNVVLYNGFVPSYGNSFEILQYGQLSGDFGTVNYPALSGGLSWGRTTSATAMTITVVPEPSTYAISAIATAGLASLMRWRKRWARESTA